MHRPVHTPNVLSFFAQSYEAAVTLDPEQAQAWMNMGGIRHIQVGVRLCVLALPAAGAAVRQVHFLQNSAGLHVPKSSLVVVLKMMYNCFRGAIPETKVQLLM